ncbi:ankyrin repeat domain-containing protein [Streptomyces sp. NPDC046821]|uniref:ankyrin repeat domain-containing protein n=1 Tax=Streptomyces sp. NPDC046821 TaxID=3154702 RepID=UPI0033C0654A
MDDKVEAAAAGLFEAVYGGDEDAVVRALRAGAPADGPGTDDEGRTALYVAAVSDEPGIVRLLLAAGADPDGLSSGTDLPLCGAACGGHTEVVRALLAAGARVDLREEFGFTAMAWAVQRGRTEVVRALLDGGADPSLPGPGGLPLVAAARRGSTGCVRALLEHGARGRAEALEEARAWCGVDVAAALRAGLEQPGREAVTQRFVEDGGVTVVVELLDDAGCPTSGNDLQTGHAAIATLLEADLEIAVPAGELADRALRRGDPDDDDWTEAVAVLRGRGDEVTFGSASAWCASGEPLRQAFGADVLGQLGPRGRYAGRSVPLLRALARTAGDPVALRSAVVALGQLGDAGALPEIVRHAGHRDVRVRRSVALALTGLVPAGHEEGVRALVTLTGDADGDVRNWAAAGLAGAPADTADVREALVALLGDPVADAAAEAARGLAVRRDPRAVDALARLLAVEAPGGYAYDTARDAVRFVPDVRVRNRLERTLPRCR